MPASIRSSRSKRYQPNDREPEGEHHRQAARQDHRPERPLFGGQRGPSTGIEQGQPEEEGPGQPGDQGEGEERP